MNSNVLLITRNFSRYCIRAIVLTAGLTASVQVAHAQRNADEVRVSVSYDVTMPRPDAMEEVDIAMNKAREMVYARVKQECAQMMQHFAQSCELTQLDIKQGVKSSHRKNRQGTMSIRANARYAVGLKAAEK